MDFDWPLKKTWKGYLIPDELCSVPCPKCEGTGHNQETLAISKAFYDFDNLGTRWCDSLTQDEVQTLVDRDRLWDLTHEWTPEKKWQPREPFIVPTPEQVAKWNKGSFGHDAINRWILIETRAKRLGVWGKCFFCEGEGELWKSAEQKAAHDAWTASPPPEGDGWQMWETTSEGSPISPVCESPEALAKWLADNNASTFGRDTASYETWLGMIESTGWAMSAVTDSKGFRSGVDAIAELSATN